MNYCMNYCEEKGISISKLNKAQKKLYFIAEHMKMDKSISEEGYEYFQQAIKALEQESILDKIFCIVHPLSIMSTPEREHKAIMQIAEMLEPLCLPESEEAIKKYKEPFINKPCVSEKVCEHDKQMVLDKIRAEIAEYGSIWVEYKITGRRDKDIEQLVSDVLSQAKKQVLDVIDKYKAESEES